MTEFDLLDLIGEADDQYIMESRKRPGRRAKKFPWQAAIAAVLALALIGGAGAAISRQRGAASASAPADGTVMQAESATAEAPEAAFEEAVEAPTMEEAAEEAVPAEEAGEAQTNAQDTATPGVGEDAITQYAAVTPLAAAVYPPSLDPEDFEAYSDKWTENQTSDDTKAAMNAFSYATAAKILPGRGESVCYSPLSLYQALSILASGAQGSTRDQMLGLLGQSDPATLADQAGKLYRVNYENNDQMKLVIANSLWLDNTAADGSPISYNQDWVLSAAADYYADVYAAEFAQEDTALALGAWIAQKTGGLLHPDPETLGFDDSTVMAIVNTLWYESSWAVEFDPEQTEQGDFTAADGETVQADFMYRVEDSGTVIQTAEYTKSALPLAKGRMVFVLPQEGVDVDSLLTEEKLWEIFENGDYTGAEVTWRVPRFATDATLQLKDTLQELGVTDAFDSDAADFSPISDAPLLVSRIQQGTHFALNEEGVEAAAYTAIAIAGAAEPMEEPPKVEMNLNRPFIYLLTADDGSILFMGVVRNPEA